MAAPRADREGWTDVGESGQLKNILSCSVLTAQVKPASALVLISLGVNILMVETGGSSDISPDQLTEVIIIMDDSCLAICASQSAAHELTCSLHYAL